MPIAAEFHWSVGNWMERFFEGLRNRKMVASKCGVCGRVYLPPRMICERCFEKTEEWVELPETGAVESFTQAHVQVGYNGDMEALTEPEIIALIKHDNADTCVCAKLDAESAEVGMRVRVVWNEAPESVLDTISCYSPDK